jgi:hypothetical protein
MALPIIFGSSSGSDSASADLSEASLTLAALFAYFALVRAAPYVLQRLR